MAKAFDTMSEVARAGVTPGMTSDHAAVDGELVDER
jgi:hypothetical protein